VAIPTTLYWLPYVYHLKCNPNYNGVWKLTGDSNLRRWMSHLWVCITWLLEIRPLFLSTVKDTSFETVQPQTCYMLWTLPVYQKFVTIQFIVVLFGISLSGHCWILHRQCQAIFMWNRLWEWAYVVLMNTSHLYLHSFCAIGDGNSWATGITLTGVSWRKLGKSNAQGK
jgi:hypothetical protein